jgi:hypothetical protein
MSNLTSSKLDFAAKQGLIYAMAKTMQIKREYIVYDSEQLLSSDFLWINQVSSGRRLTEELRALSRIGFNKLKSVLFQSVRSQDRSLANQHSVVSVQIASYLFVLTKYCCA